ncbi:MAG: hypothetical protein HN613_04475 [Gammaproteobacteria bacterium]|jgi:ATP synthase protein I|nr:hypothetical protein [Gammaproteobacteria bacterium]MBT7603703.1 hypothetical protein [Gammaproteobacteria bacterium]
MFLRKLLIELCIYATIASILWYFFDIRVASSFLYGVSVSFLSNAYSLYVMLIYRAKSIKEEVKRFYIAEFGKWSISLVMFALIFLNLDEAKPLIFFAAFIFANLLTIFFIKHSNTR